MAIYDAGTASLSADGTVTGVGTTWRQPLTLIRVGATMIFNTAPASIVTIAEIISDTEIRVFNDKGFTAPAGTQYSILAHDGITVQGLAQDVAETLRYYQSRETEVADAVDAFNNFDANEFNTKVSQVNTQHGEVVAIGSQVSADATQVAADKNNAAASAASALADKNAAAESAAEAADSAASLNTSNLLRVDRSLSDLTDKELSRTNLDVYSKAEVDSGFKIARSDAQLISLIKEGGDIMVSYSPVTVNQIVNITSRTRLYCGLPRVDVITSQFWIRGPRTYNVEASEFDYSDIDLSIEGNFVFDFSSQSESNDPGVGLALQAGGNIRLKGIEAFGGYDSNITIDYGKFVEVSDIYSHDCGRGKKQQPDGSNRTGMALIVLNPTRSVIKSVRTRNTWASSVFIDSYSAGRTLSLIIDNVDIDTSGGNGLRIQSDDLVRVTNGPGDAISRVNISNLSVRGCESHGIRANFRNGVVSGVYIEKCNAGLSIEAASDVVYSNITMLNCYNGILCRYYNTDVTRLKFNSISITGSGAEAIYFLRGSSNTSGGVGRITFSDVTIVGNGVSGSKGIIFNGGGTSEVDFNDVNIYGVEPITSGGYYCEVINNISCSINNMKFSSCTGSAEAYLRMMASTIVSVNSLISVLPSGAVNRPLSISAASPTYSSVSNCIVPNTTSGSIGYASPLPGYRYEMSNQFTNSVGPYLYTTSGTSTSRTLSSTSTTSELASVLSTLITDLQLGRYVTK